MTDTGDIDRRRFIASIGTVVAGASVAGCTAPGTTSSSAEQSPSGETEADAGGATATPTPTEEATTAAQSGGGDVPSSVSSYLSDTSNFDGSVTDATGQDTVTVEVGASGNNGNFAYAPAAVEISTGTTVQWEWTGKGAAHNVVAEDETFNSGSSESGTGVKFEYTFEETGVYNYYCTPHKALGMKGSVIVR
ncbi:halocyanin [Haloarcula taiwanensis]|uniref:Halocyanin n=1 Tax=Haloarcula taiwanensis TaxID=1932004 RepID=A0A2H4ZZ33_9EURY|nr:MULTISPECIES: halocyanin domain-containing protein [Haloarcula]AUG47738.1 halocyanin [Haloarcula taiwanensis]RLM40330.1 halocyanin domain-containing protein [Haloarcula sp. Atlit-120R]RLM48349.1 halocyanin domain-containing protein [Haloarcula sp. Atlit-47R]